MSITSNHSAAGQLAGYLFQPERALHHLATSPRGTVVGIETLDDVTVRFPNGKEIREQDKHYVSDKKPLSDRSKELWNSLNIWLKAAAEEEVDLPSTKFFLVTNQKLENGIAFDLMNGGKSKAASLAFAKRLRMLGSNPPESLKNLFNEVLAYSDNDIAALVARIDVFDQTCATDGLALRNALADHLHLPPAHADEILDGLLGWLDNAVLQLIRGHKPAWINREAFDTRYHHLLYRYQDLAFVRETEEALIPVDEKEREARKNSLFVKQLRWIGCSEEDGDNEILEAIDTHIRAGVEAIRLSDAGIVPIDEFKYFDDRLFSRWKNLRRVHIPKPLPTVEHESQKVGRLLLNHTLNHREHLAGMQTTEYYLTQGAYHRLADDSILGWHPNFQSFAEAARKRSKETNAAINGS